MGLAEADLIAYGKITWAAEKHSTFSGEERTWSCWECYVFRFIMWALDWAWSLGLEDGWLGLGAGNVSGRHRRIAGPFVTSVLFLSQQLKTSAPLHMVDESIQPNKPRTIMAHHGPRWRERKCERHTHIITHPCKHLDLESVQHLRQCYQCLGTSTSVSVNQQIH